MIKQQAGICRKFCIFRAQSNNYLEEEHFSRNGTSEGGLNYAVLSPGSNGLPYNELNQQTN